MQDVSCAKKKNVNTSSLKNISRSAMLSTFHAASLRRNSSHCYDRGLRSTTYLALGTDFTTEFWEYQLGQSKELFQVLPPPWDMIKTQGKFGVPAPTPKLQWAEATLQFT